MSYKPFVPRRRARQQKPQDYEIVGASQFEKEFWKHHMKWLDEAKRRGYWLPGNNR